MPTTIPQPQTFTCTRCHRDLPLSRRREYNGRDYCPACLEEYTILCQDCGARIPRDRDYGSDDHPLCRDCYERDYTSCSRCGRLLRRCDARYDPDDETESSPYCFACFCNGPEHSIREYSYKPTPYFHGQGHRFFGVEPERTTKTPGAFSISQTKTNPSSTASTTAVWRRALKSSPTPAPWTIT